MPSTTELTQWRALEACKPPQGKPSSGCVAGTPAKRGPSRPNVPAPDVPFWEAAAAAPGVLQLVDAHRSVHLWIRGRVRGWRARHRAEKTCVAAFAFPQVGIAIYTRLGPRRPRRMPHPPCQHQEGGCRQPDHEE